MTGSVTGLYVNDKLQENGLVWNVHVYHTVYVCRQYGMYLYVLSYICLYLYVSIMNCRKMAKCEMCMCMYVGSMACICMYFVNICLNVYHRVCIDKLQKNG